jgi:Mor family transcriptional regulator
MTKTICPDTVDPLEILREEAHAAALCHGVERCDELAAALVERYTQRLGGGAVYVRHAKSAMRARIVEQICKMHDGNNTREVAREFGYTVRQVQRIVRERHELNKKVLSN